ncbi:MAG: hypothetical protein L0Z70_14350 [Chloroflexi bacterium]|nr:hypothetical protein [Chloroflexota bacterium]
MAGSLGKKRIKRAGLKRPRGVAIAALLVTLQGLWLAALGAYAAWQRGWGLGMTNPDLILFSPYGWIQTASSAGFLLTLALLDWIVALALLRLARWAWLAAMALQGLGLFLALVAYSLHRPSYLAMGGGILVVIYLIQGEVQDAFRAQAAQP